MSKYKNSKPETTNVTITTSIVDGNRYAKFREKEEIRFLKDIFGPELAKRYFYGFAKMSEWTLVVKQEKRVSASASLKIYGGTLQISELVLPDGQVRLIENIFGNIESWAKNGTVLVDIA